MDSKERYEKAVEGLGQAIFHLTWLGHFWGIGGVIVLDEIRSWYIIYKLRGDKAGTLSGRSSTYYAAAGNAKARAAQSFLTKIWWLMLMFLCFARSLQLSNRLVKLVGIKRMDPGQLDVRSHILRRAGRHEEAIKCVEEALSRKDVAINSKVLLLMGRAESLIKLGHTAYTEVAYREALVLKNQVPISTQVRLLRSYAAHRRVLGNDAEAEQLLQEAKNLAIKDALGDQLKKIEAARSELDITDDSFLDIHK